MSDFSRMMELAMTANATKTSEALGVAPAEAKPTSGSGASEHPTTSAASQSADTKRK